MRPRIATTVLTFAAVLLGAAAPAFADTSPSSTRIDRVKIRDTGAAVRVTLDLTCPTGATAALTVTVTAAGGTRIAQGTGRIKATTCTGTAQTLAKRVDADPAGALFITGQATARTVRTVCDTAGCATTSLDETIRIK